MMLFNYLEKPFKDSEIKLLKDLLKQENVKRITLPCCAPVKGKHSFIFSETKEEPVVRICKDVDELAVIGSCVFWDNSSVVLENNQEFATNLSEKPHG